MSHATLTARYRPQTFAQAAGQDTLRAILSRAAAEDRVAPAYLFSGTRGVGKTTLARVFAKALNCVHAPAAEPCNECERCRQITLGMAVDVVEIDGASNRGIDDVRRLKEVVGYAPMDGRYKVFIIDEAHMLSRDAFNALLKTLEEPPARVTFIMATTEAHKFPATILSRCQHYVFKRLSEAELEAHLSRILNAESVPFEDAAVRLLARRASGSVRDGMSLLGQVLALGGETLTEADTRRVLGLAGQEMFFRLLDSLRDGDCLAVSQEVRGLMDGGLDLGFFLRELTLVWRNLFMLGQSGEAAMAATGLPEAEAGRWLKTASGFSPTHVHAAWQMTVDSQRRVLTSLEPAQALELLLLNIAMLPRLLPLDQLRPAATSGAAGQGGTGSAPAGPGKPQPSSPPATGSASAAAAAPEALSSSVSANASESSAQRAPVAMEAAKPASQTVAANSANITQASVDPAKSLNGKQDSPHPAAPASPASRTLESSTHPEAIPPWEDSPEPAVPATAAAGPTPPWEDEPEPVPPAAGQNHEQPPCPSGPVAAPTQAVRTGTDWEGFLRFMAGREGLPPGFAVLIRPCRAEVDGGIVSLTPPDSFIAGRLAQTATADILLGLLRDYFGEAARFRVEAPVSVTKTMQQVKAEAMEHPGVKLLMQTFNARLASCEQITGQ